MKINIQFNKFLDPVFTGYVKGQEKYKDVILPTTDEVIERVKKYNEIWNEWGDKIITEMQSIMGIQFIKDQVIDVHIVSLNPRPFSNPIVMKSGYTPDAFVDNLIHELIHVLYKNDHAKWVYMINDTHKQYPNENGVVGKHIIVYSIINHIYKNIGKVFENPITPSEVNNDYIKARELATK